MFGRRGAACITNGAAADHRKLRRVKEGMRSVLAQFGLPCARHVRAPPAESPMPLTLRFCIYCGADPPVRAGRPRPAFANRIKIRCNARKADPQVLFTANFTGLAIADFLLGRENTFTQGSPNAGSPRTFEVAVYAQDDWKVARRLTLNMGLRWDPWLPYRDALHAISQFRQGRQSTIYPTAPPGYVFLGDSGDSDTSIQSRWNNWGPRLGFAYDLLGNGKTSLRGGWGMFYSDVRQQSLNNISS